MKNRKGFTLVELLAVIVILALIMSIAIVSISGVLQDSREKAYRETAVSIIKGVRQRLALANEQKAGAYYFTRNILESGGKQSPFGNDLTFRSDQGTQVNGTTDIYYVNTVPTCSASAVSFVSVAIDSTTNKVTYSICLTAGEGNKYVEGTEDDIMTAANSSSVIKG